MEIVLQNISKSFNKDLIFGGITLKINKNEPLAIVGNNGSGKSTLLQLIASQLYPTSGSIIYTVNNQIIHPDKIYPYISYAAPYQELMEELTLEEHLKFHTQFRALKNNLSEKEVVDILQLRNHTKKPIAKFSSGMKQKVKLGLAILSETPYLFLDEPVSNLDSGAIAWYKETLKNYLDNRIVIISSNHHPDEIFCCNHQLDVRAYKNK
ncbi:MAG: ATP-binding cassette domain-containing protein [Bacteroidia bacterium]|nr:ATP-binding cassette domain-containing protein [Bacteroidia bacterium]